jgi:Holliday junction resolvase
VGRASRDKGNRTERNVVAFLREHGIEAERVPLSGAAQGSFGGDIRLKETGQRVEVKARANGFSTLYRWLEGNDFLFVKADRRETLVVMTLEEFSRLFNGPNPCRP